LKNPEASFNGLYLLEFNGNKNCDEFKTFQSWKSFKENTSSVYLEKVKSSTQSKKLKMNKMFLNNYSSALYSIEFNLINQLIKKI